MRQFCRPPVRCQNCNAKIYWNASLPQEFDTDTIVAPGEEPPGVQEQCPRCNGDVDTTPAYAAIPGFPPTFTALQQAYQEFVPFWESNRASFESTVATIIRGDDFSHVEQALNDPGRLRWYTQRMFYRSCTAFYRSLQLFFAFLILEGRCFSTWANITGYYSRFFFIQALLNLALSTWDSLNKCFFFFDGARVRCLPQRSLSPTIKNAGSHEVWWQLMEAVKRPTGYPMEHLHFILTRLVFNPAERNNANYGFEYLRGGFIELDWFDSGARQMMSQFMPGLSLRSDRDVTDINRFFGDRDPEECDVGDFYGDDAQIIWCSPIDYLRLMKALGFAQNFILTENVAALAEVHLAKDYPRIMNGVLLSVEECLNTGFDVAAFMRDREAHPDRLSLFWPA